MYQSGQVTEWRRTQRDGHAGLTTIARISRAPGGAVALIDGKGQLRWEEAR